MFIYCNRASTFPTTMFDCAMSPDGEFNAESNVLHLFLIGPLERDLYKVFKR